MELRILMIIEDDKAKNKIMVSTPHRVYTFEQIYEIVWKE